MIGKRHVADTSAWNSTKWAVAALGSIPNAMEDDLVQSFIIIPGVIAVVVVVVASQHFRPSSYLF